MLAELPDSEVRVCSILASIRGGPLAKKCTLVVSDDYVLQWMGCLESALFVLSTREVEINSWLSGSIGLQAC